MHPRHTSIAITFGVALGLLGASQSAHAEPCNDPDIGPGDVAFTSASLDVSTGEVTVQGSTSGSPGCRRLRVTVDSWSTTADVSAESFAVAVATTGLQCGQEVRLTIDCSYKLLSCQHRIMVILQCGPTCPSAAALTLTNSAGVAVGNVDCVAPGTYTATLTQPIIPSPTNQVYWTVDDASLDGNTDDMSIAVSVAAGSSHDIAVTVLPGSQCPPRTDSEQVEGCAPSECGDGHVDSGETCDGSSCPTSCSNSSGRCYELIGSAGQCDASCHEVDCPEKCAKVTACVDGDGCCQAGCTSADTDCDAPPAKCAGVTQCVKDDECCPGACDANSDNDCGCGWRFWECIELNLCWLLALAALLLASIGIVLLAFLPTASTASRWETINGLAEALTLGGIAASSLIEALIFGGVIAILFAICPCQVALGVAIGCLSGIVVVLIVLYYSGSSAVPSWILSVVLGVLGIVGMLAYYALQCA